MAQSLEENIPRAFFYHPKANPRNTYEGNSYRELSPINGFYSLSPSEFDKLNPSQRQMYFMDYEDALARPNNQQYRIMRSVNNSINMPKPSRLVPKFIPKPKYTGPKVMYGSAEPSIAEMLKWYWPWNSSY